VRLLTITAQKGAGFVSHRELKRGHVSEGAAFIFIPYPGGIYEAKVHTEKEKRSTESREQQKLIARVRRIRGQVDAIERSLSGRENCADVLMLLANVRGGINSLMAEVLEDHIRLHMMPGEKTVENTTELAEDLIDLVRAYLK